MIAYLPFGLKSLKLIFQFFFHKFLLQVFISIPINVVILSRQGLVQQLYFFSEGVCLVVSSRILSYGKYLLSHFLAECSVDLH